MSESNKESLPEVKKSRRNLWLILGAGIVLMVVYQSGRSAGVNSARESSPVRPAVSQPAARPSNSAPRTYRRIPLEGESVPPNTVPQPHVVSRNVVTDIAIPTESPVASRARVIETVPIGPVQSSQVPRFAAVNSVYEHRSQVNCACGPDCPSGCNCGCGHGRSPVLQAGFGTGQPSGGSARPSEVGLIPLQPLQPVSVGQSGVVQATYRQASSPGVGAVPARVPVRSAVTCDCGKEH